MDKKELLEILKVWKDEIKSEIKSEVQTIIKENLGENFSKIIEQKINSTEERVKGLEREIRNKNIIIHGLIEDETDNYRLQDKVIGVIKSNILSDFNIHQIDNLKRIGRNTEGKIRPILLSVLSIRIKNIILKYKKKLNNYSQSVYLTEDITKDILPTRKSLIPELIKAREDGKLAIIKYDELIIKDNNTIENLKKRPMQSKL